MSLNDNYNTNPYNPMFGTPPEAYIHRYKEENQILNEFCAPNARPLSYMIIGARGMGKTVLMNELANRFETFPEWVVVRLNPNRNMVESLMRKLSGHKKVAPIIKSAKLNLSFFSLTIGKSDTSQIKDEEDAITEIIKELKKDGKRVLIAVDEATNTETMKAFASSYQTLVGQKLPVYLLMTGLYENVSSLKNVKNLTFLYRMPRVFLSPLQQSEISENYRDVFLLNESEANEMAAYTKGFSYGFQLLGKIAWDNEGDYKPFLSDYRRDLYEMVYEKVWDEMSPKDKELAYSIASTPDGRVKSIREKLKWEPNELSPYKDRLLKKGIILSPSYGHLEMALPYFKGFVLDSYVEIVKPEDLPEDL